MSDTTSESHDEALISAVVKGDKVAFRHLVHKHEKLVTSIVFKMIHQRQDGEDLCQDIFLKVYEKLPTFRFQSRLSTWIGSIAFNTCINFLKKQKPVLLEDFLKSTNEETNSRKRGVSLFPDTGKTPVDELLDKEKESMMLRMIDQLSTMQKTVLSLFHSNELSLEEISVITGLPVNTVKSHLFRARKQLKEAMSNY